MTSLYSLQGGGSSTPSKCSNDKVFLYVLENCEQGSHNNMRSCQMIINLYNLVKVQTVWRYVSVLEVRIYDCIHCTAYLYSCYLNKPDFLRTDRYFIRSLFVAVRPLVLQFLHRSIDSAQTKYLRSTGRASYILV